MVYDLYMRERLTPKQAKFVIEYLVDLNGSAAAVRAGYSEDTAKEIASENLTKPNIKEAIQEQMDCRAQRTLITADWVVAKLKEVSLRCLEEKPVFKFDKVNKEMVGKTAMIKDEETGEMKEVGIYEFDAAGANKALETMARHLKLLTDRSEIGNLDGTNLTPPVIERIYVGKKEDIPSG